VPGTPQLVTGLARVPDDIRGQRPPVRFEQYERHTAWDKSGELARNAHRFVSRLAAGRFLGYLQAQKASMTGQAGACQPARTRGGPRI
jgi:uncharacterized protein